jgi:structural maintenance of chromosome 2
LLLLLQVLNMKPPEILGMIEEAAGTRMFETKKQSALKTMDKKQTKVDEINSILTEEITPTLEKLRGEKGHYLQWSANNTEAERLERFCVAHGFKAAELTVAASAEELEGLKEEAETLKDDVDRLRGVAEAKEVSHLSYMLLVLSVVLLKALLLLLLVAAAASS